MPWSVAPGPTATAYDANHMAVFSGRRNPQYLVVVGLAGSGTCSIKQLAGLLHLDHDTLTPILRRITATLEAGEDHEDGTAQA
ncbi:hypothetical protein [Serinicoccus marinus]|uniref:hypothetical protein n=1 Tax=Serinicoccus marinus TaxID=247333 RepID=UPI0024901498|nr:hypothetical protein [Serinicoccus marinus]